MLIPTSEMGQGTLTALAMVLAEELDVPWDRVRAQSAPARAEYQVPGYIQRTGASRTVRERYGQLRRIGAVVRGLFLEAAATRWNVPLAECRTHEGLVIHMRTDRRVPYQELFLAVLAIPLESRPGPTLKSPADFRIIGTNPRRLDLASKLNGSAQFGIDIQVDGMLHAAVYQPPTIGATVSHFDRMAVLGEPGVEAVVAVPGGVAAVAADFWHAQRALRAIRARIRQPRRRWANLDEIEAALGGALDKKPIVVRQGARPSTGPRGDTVEASYLAAFQAHAPLEPLNCTVDLSKDRCDVWIGTQQQTRALRLVAELTGLPADRVTVHTPFIGGSFGRNLETDIIPQAIAVAREVKRPVKLTWGREDNFRHDFFRPIVLIRLRATVDDDGWPLTLEARVVGPSGRRRSNPALLKQSYDRTLVDGLDALPYDIPSYRLEYTEVDLGVPVGWLRGVAFVPNVFALESFIDELADKAGHDPIAYRRHLARGDTRLIRLLDAAAERAGWSGRARVSDSTAMGVAMTIKDDTRVVHVAEIAGDPLAGGRVTRLVTAVDPGLLIHPSNGIAMVEGSTVFGLSNTWQEGIGIRRGEVEQDNFDDYRILRISEAPEVTVLLMPDGSAPVGLGEAGVDTAGPAVANAIARLTGRRLRRIPWTDDRPVTGPR